MLAKAGFGAGKNISPNREWTASNALPCPATAIRSAVPASAVNAAPEIRQPPADGGRPRPSAARCPRRRSNRPGPPRHPAPPPKVRARNRCRRSVRRGGGGAVRAADPCSPSTRPAPRPGRPRPTRGWRNAVRRPWWRRYASGSAAADRATYRRRGRADLRGHQHHLAQHAVDEGRRLVGGQFLASSTASSTATGSGRPRRAAVPHGHPQHGAVHGGQPLQGPALQVRGDQLVDVRGVLGDPRPPPPCTGSAARCRRWSRPARCGRRRPPPRSCPGPRPRRAGPRHACGPDAGPVCLAVRHRQAFTRRPAQAVRH